MLSVTNPKPFPACPSPFNMAAYVLSRADALPDKVAVAVVSEKSVESFTYAKLVAAVRGTGTGFLQAGCKPGDKILLRLGNTIDFPIAYLGALAVGLVPIPTSAALSVNEVALIVAQMQPRIILRDPDVTSVPGAPEIGLAALREMRALPPAPWDMGDPDRLGYIVYTSGTSGAPRAVAHAHRAIWARRMMHQGWYGLRPDDVLMHAGAFNWTYTLGTGLMDPWSVGATALVPGSGTPPETLCGLLARHNGTLFAAAPGVYRQMLARGPLHALPDLRHALSAGEKLPAATQEAWQAATGTQIYEAYGLSECSTFISSNPEAPCEAQALGRPQPGRWVAIIGAQGPVPVGDTGIISVHQSDPGLMIGYLGHPAETQAKFKDDWFLTGDLGRMGADGQIHYLGRDDDMMNAGGYRVSPIEVEAVVSAAPGVTSAGAAEVEVKPGVHVIVAFYSSAAPLDEDALRTYVEPNLATYKQPRAYIRVKQMPMSANGKILRRRLHLYWPKNTKAH